MTDAPGDLDELSLLGLFRTEVELQTGTLSAGLVALERDPSAEQMDELMRAAHSLKGAARIVQLDAAVELSHAMEDYFTGLQSGELSLLPEHVDALLQGVDLLQQLGQREADQLHAWLGERAGQVVALAQRLRRAGAPGPPLPSGVSVAEVAAAAEPVTLAVAAARLPAGQDRFVRVNPESLDRLMGLAGESLVDSLWLRPFSDSLLQLRGAQSQLARALTGVRAQAEGGSTVAPQLRERLSDMEHKLDECRRLLAQRLEALEAYGRRSADLSDRLYREVVDARMRPFADVVQGLPRVGRDVARRLGKRARVDIAGAATPVDRDIIEKLEAPLTHLLRNALDHGIEAPEQRRVAGKPEEGVVCLEARHRAGMLSITVSDDGGGIDLDRVRAKVLQLGLAEPESVARMGEAEILEFMYLPRFSTAAQVTEYSGRGVGLDVVHTAVQEVGGTLQVTTRRGAGTTFHLQLPLTLAVSRNLLVRVGEARYAIPMARANRVLDVSWPEVETLEGKGYVQVDGARVGLVPAHQVLEVAPGDAQEEEDGRVRVVVLGDAQGTYGLVVDELLGEHELVVRPLHRRLGKVRDVSSAAFTDDGEAVLVLDVEDVVRSMDELIAQGRLRHLAAPRHGEAAGRRRRVLVIDDSLTVREVERRLLENHGYEVATAVDGVDGWSALRRQPFDLVITDVDMPRMTGIELVRQIRHDPRLRETPVMIVSYKEREEDRLAGMEAGANYYLTKSSFHDETLLQAVADLIGGA